LSVVFVIQKILRQTKRRTQKWDISRGRNFGRERGIAKLEL